MKELSCFDHQWENLRQVHGLKVLNFVRNEEDTKNAVKFFAEDVAQCHTAMVDISDLPNASRIHLSNYVYADTFENAVESAKRFNEQINGKPS